MHTGQVACWILCAVLIHPAASAADLESIQGRWTLVSQTEKGELRRDLLDTPVEIKGDQLTLYYGPNRRPIVCKITLDESVRPKQIDWEQEVDTLPVKVTFKGVYDLGDDAMLVCLPRKADKDHQRPTSLGNGSDERTSLLVLARRKPKKEPDPGAR